ncbi:MAG: exodeoxyribonuclease V subunit alpha [Desulforegulaceae bacterium]|nr:exodeoxyribonuclease V subunit alpha [Desulforegulaceae bacterium]
MNRLTNPDLDYNIYNSLKEEYSFSFLDFYFSKFLLENEAEKSFILYFFLMYLSMQTRKGSICIDLDKDEKISEFLAKYVISKDLFKKEIYESSFVGTDDKNLPVIFEKNLFYLNRYYNYEKFFAEFIMQKSQTENYDLKKIDKLKKIIQKYFPLSEINPDWQKFAAITACISNFCAVSGGPGTGKTTVTVKIIAILLELDYPKKPEILLCAPTGKAASRMVEAIISAISNIGLDDEIKKYFPVKASTIHRLLGFLPKTNKFLYNKENRLKADIVIVDEASMIDMKLMSNLCEALEDDAKLILLGDRFQLASVSPGSVFGDICKRGEKIGYSEKYIDVLKEFYDEKGLEQIPLSENIKISDSISELKKSYRFDEKSGIGKLAEAVKNVDLKKCSEIFNSDLEDIEFIEPENYSDFKNNIKKFALKNYKRLLDLKDPDTAFKFFSEFMILSPLNEGDYGISTLNSIIENLFTSKKNSDEKNWYNGKPVIITQNDYVNNLFNGDTGICLENEKGEKKVFFQSLESEYKTVHPVRLNELKTVFAMTVHKSQGSEFDNILITLPDYDSKALSRELIYTAITRAKKKVYFLGSRFSFYNSIKRSVSRSSGLYYRLWT